ncbi:hypothetical protein ACFYNZ_02290 [Streptomyces kebangsaanensis]|uniref:Uncharacterized protein n=1 Tax=Streptomyces kebangsaanensis TaxID=864058 RepID=A0ABW6KLN1_9ACTN
MAVALWFAWAIPAFFDRPDLPVDELFGKQVGLTQYRLEHALEGGALTEEENAYDAAGEKWRTWLESETPRIVVEYRVNGSHQCYSFTFPDGLNKTATVENAELDHCSF